jgi:hypothetical protein
VIDCLYLAQRGLMDFDIRVVLEPDALIIVMSKDYVNIMMHFTNLMIDNMKMTEEGLASLLCQTARAAWVKIR